MRLAAFILALGGMQLASAAQVEVHPAGSFVPENLLRIELRFPRAQRVPFDINQVKLLDSTGLPIQDAFLDLTLPSADGRRVTILMNPGRVKTGVRPNLAMGRALHAGSTVRLVVEGPSAGPHPVVKEWVVTAFEPRGPQPTRWRLSAPRLHTRDALIVSLRAPITSSAEGLIAVSDASGRRVEGHTNLSDGDTVWRFTPDTPWQNGPHAVVTHPDLEDPAGNRICAAFEQQRASEVRCDAGVTLPFQLGRDPRSR